MIEALVDYRSPYSYLAVCNLQRLGESFETTLIDVGWVMAQVKNQPSPNCPPKAKYAFMDAARSAAHEGIPFAPNMALLGAVRAGALPARTLMRAGIAARKLGLDLRFNMAIASAMWAGTEDLTSPEARSQLLAANGIDAPTLWDDAAAEWTEAALNKNNARAVEKGVFGVPTIFVDDEMFFGNDRMPMIRRKAGAESVAA